MTNPLLNHQHEIDQALFLAIGRADYPTASELLAANANPNAIFPVEKNVYTSSTNLLISQTAQVGASKGPNNNQYIAAMKLVRELIKTASLVCKSTKEHQSPLYVALEAFKITTEEQILECKCDLIRELILKGATIKFEPKQDEKANKKVGKWALRWLDIDGIRNYLITKNYQYKETKVEV